MPGSWETPGSVLAAVLHTDDTSIAWAFGLRRLQIPGPLIGLAGMPYDMARNLACMRALEAGVDYLFFLDSDVIPPHDAVLRLMKHKLPIVSGMYCRRSPPAAVPVMMKPIGQWLTRFKPNSLVEVDCVGAGCLLIHTDVLRALPPQRDGSHWFDWRVDQQQLDREKLPPLSEDFTFCFPKNTWVMGSRVKTIDQINVGERIVNHMGALAKVLDKSNRIYSGEMIRITASFVRQIESTPGHRFYVRTVVGTGRQAVLNAILVGKQGTVQTRTEVGTKKTLWLEAKDIKPGDWLYIPKTRFRKDSCIRSFSLSHFISTKALTEFADGTLGYKRTRKDALRIRPQIAVTPELCRLLGYYLAEGFSPGKGKMGKKQSLQFAFGATEVDYVADCRELLEEIFGARTTLKIVAGCARITCSSKILGRLFSALCGNGAHDKHLPRFWPRLERSYLTELVKGYWRGDGYYNRNFSMVTVSETLARGIQSALLRLDILAGVNQSENKYGAIWTITIPIQLSGRFSTIVGYPCDHLVLRKQNRYLRETKTHFLVQVQNTERFLWEGVVYNLKVEGRESYTANGVGVHNCVHARKHGFQTMVDTSIRCKHIGLAEADFGIFRPVEAVA